MISEKMQERLRQMGSNLRLARRRRRKSLRQAAEMMGASLSSLRRMEAGDGAVRMETWLAALEVLQLEDTLRFGEPEDDRIGLTLEKQHLPKRIREKEDKRLDF